jgi:starch-binding outer membrane protein, SusD/RagB family
MMTPHTRLHRRPAFAALAACATVAIVFTACDASQPLVVKDPDVSQPSTAVGPNALPFLRAGTLADFAVGLVGASDLANNGHEGVADFGAIFTDEFNDFDTFPTRFDMNSRLATPGNSSLAGVFQNLGAAHNDARRSLAQYVQYGANTEGEADMYIIDAYVYILIAEHWCSGEPFSTINISTGQVVNSAYLTTAQMLDTAMTELELAKVALRADTVDPAGDTALYANTARVGQARVLLDLGQIAAAADTAAIVPSTDTGYQIYESVNSPRQESGVWNYTINFPAFGVADAKNGTGLDFHAAQDPRVPTVPTATVGSNGQGPFWIQQKYPSGGSPMMLADYIEAQMVVAEGDVFAGNYAGAKAIMNTLRGTVGLGPVADSSARGPKSEIEQILTERAFWFFVTGHRLGDWRRVLRPPYNMAPYNFVVSDVYPVGPGIQNTLEFPTPVLTNPNPGYVACDATQP